MITWLTHSRDRLAPPTALAVAALMLLLALGRSQPIHAQTPPNGGGPFQVCADGSIFPVPPGCPGQGLGTVFPCSNGVVPTFPSGCVSATGVGCVGSPFIATPTSLVPVPINVPSPLTSTLSPFASTFPLTCSTGFVQCADGSVVAIGAACPATITTAAVPVQAVAPAPVTIPNVFCNGNLIPANEICPSAPFSTAFSAPVTITPLTITPSTSTTTTNTTTTATTSALATSVTTTPAPAAAAAPAGSSGTTPGAVTAAPTAPLADSPVYNCTYTASGDATQPLFVTIDLLSSGACATSGSGTPVQGAGLAIPAGVARGGSGSESVTLSVSNSGQPLAVSVSGACGSGATGSLTFSQPVNMCVTLPQYILDSATSQGGSVVLTDAAGNVITGSAVTGGQVCGTISAAGSYTVSVQLPSGG